MNKKILITGANGLIGTRLTELLLARHYRVAWLVRPGTKKPRLDVEMYTWDVAQGHIAATAFAGVDALVHLAGANIGAGRWTDARKREIISSRTESADLLARHLGKTPHSVKTIVASSAIGYYGNVFNGHVSVETDSPGTGFQAEVTKVWEQHLHQLATLGARLVILRTGVVLTDRGGAFPQLVQPVRFGIGSVGTGTQPLSWIHLEDICRAYLFAIETEHMDGVYNAVAPEPVTNDTMVRLIAKYYKRRIFLPHVPTWAIRAALGEQSELVLGGANVSSQKLRVAGFDFHYATAVEAVEDILHRL